MRRHFSRDTFSLTALSLAGLSALAGCAKAKAPAPAPRIVCSKVGDHYLNSQAMELMFVHAGSFAMGSPTDEPGRDEDELQHAVTLPRSFLMGKTPVTQAQYRALMGGNPSWFKGDACPVEQVSWDDAIAFCQKLTACERAAGALPEGWVYRLPTEAEWEYACRAGAAGVRYGEVKEIAWHDQNAGDTTHPVGTKAPNAWGLCDMIGNVFQWCEDGYAGYPKEPVTNPKHGPAPMRVLRGGCWASPPRDCRAALRFWSRPDIRNSNLGFRVVCAQVPKEMELLRMGNSKKMKS